MNRTTELTNAPVKMYSEDRDIENSRLQFEKIYPGISYISETDSYLYRGVEFDYYAFAINFNCERFYTLVDKKKNAEDSRIS